ncbi:hypothetical protein [Aquirhabdus sp.]|uniref:hypothetical protein n=1 Tax=Aquirhabdus sp. TaxID=2824160 RepID=UPI00396CBC81
MRSPQFLLQYLQRTLIWQIFKNHKRLVSGIALSLMLVSFLSAYFISPYWTVCKLEQDLYSQDTHKLQEKIPKQLLAHLAINPHPDHQWQGAGKNYLKHILPKLYSDIDPYAWLSVQAQVLSKERHHQYYQHYFNHYALELGENRDQLRFELVRDHILNWRVERICYPSPQPDRVSNRCPSSNR